MAATIKNAFPGVELELIRGGGGNYIIIANGERLWHKREMGDAFPEESVIVAKLRALG